MNLDDVTLSNHVINATGRSKLLTTVGKAHINRTADVGIRNHLLPFIQSTEEVCCGVAGGAVGGGGCGVFCIKPESLKTGEAFYSGLSAKVGVEMREPVFKKHEASFIKLFCFASVKYVFG